MNGIRAVHGVGTAAAPGAVVQMVGAGRRVLDFAEGRDEVCKIEDVLLELDGKVEEAEGCCEGCLMVTTHGAESGVSSESLKDRVWSARETDSAACKRARGGERGEYARSCVGGGDVTDEVEVECRRPYIPEDVRGCKRPFVQDGQFPLGRHAEGAIMLIAAFGSARAGVAAGILSFAGGDIEVDSEMAERGQSGG